MTVFSDWFNATLGNYFSYLVLLFIIVVLLFFLYYNVSRRYPKIKLMVFEGKTWSYEYRRLMERKIVPDSLIDILLKGHRIVGMNIDDFDNLIDKNGKYVYLATKRNNELLPLKLNEASIDPNELGLAKEIAVRYINTIDSTYQDLQHQNPLILSLIAVIPFAVVILLNGIIFYLAMNDMLPKITSTYQQIANMNVETVKMQSEITNNLVLIANKLGLHTNSSYVYTVPSKGG
ncbi:MAG: hypothetical protein ACPL6C_00600 [bacterium]